MNKKKGALILFIAFAIPLSIMLVFVIIKSNKEANEREQEQILQSDPAYKKTQDSLIILGSITSAISNIDSYSHTGLSNPIAEKLKKIQDAQNTVIYNENSTKNSPYMDSLLMVLRQKLNTNIADFYIDSRRLFASAFNVKLNSPNTQVSVEGKDNSTFVITSADFNLSGFEDKYIDVIQKDQIQSKFRFKKLVLKTPNGLTRGSYTWNTANDTAITNAYFNW